jgi:hypothetical protein
MMKSVLVSVAFVIALFLYVGPVKAAHCISWTNNPDPPFEPQCAEYGPDAPSGWSYTPYVGYQPVAGEVMICHKTNGYGVCVKRSIPVGPPYTVLSNLGEFENGTYRIKSYWFNLSLASTTHSQESLVCPTCTTVSAGLAGLNNDSSAYLIKAITARN